MKSLKTKEKIELIKKHLGTNTPDWVIKKCVDLLDEFEDLILEIK